MTGGRGHERGGRDRGDSRVAGGGVTGGGR